MHSLTKLAIHREQLNLDNLEAPTFIKAAGAPKPNQNQYLKFTPTALRRKDAGESTIPFLDIQPIVSQPAVPLSGLALVHKAAPESGGYLALSMSTYNVVPNLDDIGIVAKT